MSRHALRDFVSDLSVLEVVPKDVVRTEVSDMLFSGRSFCVDVVVKVGQSVLIFAVAYNYDSASASSRWKEQGTCNMNRSTKLWFTVAGFLDGLTGFALHGRVHRMPLAAIIPAPVRRRTMTSTWRLAEIGHFMSL